MNPSQAFANRTARLAREASTPVYSTTTPSREEVLAKFDHIVAIELDSDFGRSWSHMPESEADAYLDAVLHAYDLSDYCHSAKCKCGDPNFIV